MRNITAALMVCVFLASETIGRASSMPGPVMGTGVVAMVSLSAPVHPVIFKGLQVDPANPLQVDFLVDQGDEKNIDPEVFKHETSQSAKYFLAGLTVPQGELWVNLSPYEGQRIIPEGLGQTDLGKVFLEQDYLLKKLTASLLYPESKSGQQFWAEVYKQAYEKFGSTDIPVDTFNKVWIVPNNPQVYEKASAVKAAVYIVEAKLKVMLDSDYLATSNVATPTGGHVAPPVDQGERGAVSPSTLPTSQPLNVRATQVSAESTTTQSFNASAVITKQILREIIIPILEKEVNEGANFAHLRQVYHTLILAGWLKRKMASRPGVLTNSYINLNRTAGVEHGEKGLKQRVWKSYVEAFEKGVFNFIREEKAAGTDDVIPRKYFSGGFDFDKAESPTVVARMPVIDPAATTLLATFRFNRLTGDRAETPQETDMADIARRARQYLESLFPGEVDNNSVFSRFRASTSLRDQVRVRVDELERYGLSVDQFTAFIRQYFFNERVRKLTTDQAYNLKKQLKAVQAALSGRVHVGKVKSPRLSLSDDDQKRFVRSSEALAEAINELKTVTSSVYTYVEGINPHARWRLVKDDITDDGKLTRAGRRKIMRAVYEERQKIIASARTYFFERLERKDLFSLQVYSQDDRRTPSDLVKALEAGEQALDRFKVIVPNEGREITLTARMEAHPVISTTRYDGYILGVTDREGRKVWDLYYYVDKESRQIRMVVAGKFDLGKDDAPGVFSEMARLFYRGVPLEIQSGRFDQNKMSANALKAVEAVLNMEKAYETFSALLKGKENAHHVVMNELNKLKLIVGSLGSPEWSSQKWLPEVVPSLEFLDEIFTAYGNLPQTYLQDAQVPAEDFFAQATKEERARAIRQMMADESRQSDEIYIKEFARQAGILRVSFGSLRRQLERLLGIVPVKPSPAEKTTDKSQALKGGIDFNAVMPGNSQHVSLFYPADERSSLTGLQPVLIGIKPIAELRETFSSPALDN